MKVQLYLIPLLESVCNELKLTKFPLKTAYKINKLSKALEEEVQFYQQKFGEIVEEYSKKDENGNKIYSNDGANIIIADGRVVECQAKIQELQMLEVTLPDITFNLEELGDIQLSPEQFESIAPFIEE